MTGAIQGHGVYGLAGPGGGEGGGVFGGGSVSRLQYDYISMIVLIDLHLGLHLSEPAV